MMPITELRNVCGLSYEEIANLYALDVETLIKYGSRLEYPTIEAVNKVLTESSTYYDDIRYYNSEDEHMCIY